MSQRRWRRWLRYVVALFVLLGLAGFLVAASGIVSIKASAGHWWITEWFLQFTKRRSLATRTIRTDLPPLDEQWLVVKGAGQYETACRPCHGSPELEHPRIPAAMTPPPPYLPDLIRDWDPEELFYVVKHGIKFTGMPAWPTQKRDDEVHAMVAFLLAFPSLDEDGYRRLVYGETAVVDPVESLRELAADTRGPRRAVIASCERCHGIEGRGRGTPAFPTLAGQKREYMVRALAAYEAGKRHSGIMEPVAAGLSETEQHELADYYSNIIVRTRTEPAPDTLDPSVERGRTIATRGVPDRGVPACRDCHGPAEHRRNPAYPDLAGQFAEYIELQIELFKRGQRGGSEYAHLMERVAARLTEEQMRDVAAYYAALAASPDP